MHTKPFFLGYGMIINLATLLVIIFKCKEQDPGLWGNNSVVEGGN